MVSIVAALVAVAGLMTVNSAQAVPSAVTADEASSMPPAIEGFAYPDAARILAAEGITLKRGDGHILLTECDGSDDIWIDSKVKLRGFCFDVTSTSGYLALEIEDVFGIWTGEHAIEAKLTTDGAEKTVAIPKNTLEEVGEGDDTTGNKPAVLVELRVTG
jgi:hypothetical protein